ncbi:MAG: hypothetical protein HY340_00240 [Candidatus Kerfeldbacteria bacterium]|nr:hypothetical protein [Candidatus Kerfeldbacteria bacterium]
MNHPALIKRPSFFILLAVILVAVVIVVATKKPDRNGAQDQPALGIITTNTENAVAGVVRIEDVIAEPERFHDKVICLSGYYQSSFEFSGLGAALTADNAGGRVLQEPLVWVDVAVPGGTLDCSGDGRQQTCSGRAVPCGQFQYAGDKKIGFGHLGKYRYQIVNPPR